MKKSTIRNVESILAALLFCAAAFQLHASGPEVSNVVAEQRRDGSKLVDIWYDLEDDAGEKHPVSVQLLVDGSPIAATSFSGHVGEDVSPGRRRRIVWDAGADWDGQFSENVRFAVSAGGEGDYLVVDLSGGPSASSYPVSYLSSVPSGGWTDEYKTTRMVFRRIPSGTFIMGSPEGELGRVDWFDETQHQVTLTQDFYIGVFQVTQKQWERVMGNWPSLFNNRTHRNARPVEAVSYNMIRGASDGAGWPANSNVDATSFMGRLRSRTGRAFDLPTESQWEYACRAGTTTALNSGMNLTTTGSCPNMNQVGRYWYNHPGGYSSSSSVGTEGGTAKVGSYQSNNWGLYDMHGNVWEWCLDWYGTYPGTVTNPKGPSTGSYRVSRGGSWDYIAWHCRSANRYYYGSPDYAWSYIGFRVALPSGQ